MEVVMTPQGRHLVVVGAGFAGLACAGAAAARGVATTVLEARPGPGRGIRSTGILVKEAADQWDVPRHLTRKVHGVRLYSPSLRSVDLERPGYYFLATDTPGLDRWWAREAARHGAEIRWGRPFRGSRLLPDGRIQLVEHDLTCDVLVGADGAKSAVARDLGLQRNTELLVGIELEAVGVAGMADDRLHVFLDSRLAPGYIGWAVPGVHATQIGVAVRGSSTPNLERLLSRLGRVFDLSHMEIRGYRAGLIPVGGPLRSTSRGNALLIGDAAGWVSPLTAGGIHCALALGRVAGVAVADFLLDGGPHPSRIMQRRVPSFAWKRWLRRVIELQPPDRLIDLVLRSHTVRTAAKLVFFHHRGLLSRDGWAAWLTRFHPNRADVTR
jgi:flavin-dependent dehydrogenase